MVEKRNSKGGNNFKPSLPPRPTVVVDSPKNKEEEEERERESSWKEMALEYSNEQKDI